MYGTIALYTPRHIVRNSARKVPTAHRDSNFDLRLARLGYCTKVYVVATISRLLKIIGLFCEKAL